MNYIVEYSNGMEIKNQIEGIEDEGMNLYWCISGLVD